MDYENGNESFIEPRSVQDDELDLEEFLSPELYIKNRGGFYCKIIHNSQDETLFGMLLGDGKRYITTKEDLIAFYKGEIFFLGEKMNEEKVICGIKSSVLHKIGPLTKKEYKKISGLFN